MKQEQFRPNLSSLDISELLEHLPVGSRLYNKFAVFKAKISIGITKPGYIMKEGGDSRRLENKLGLETEGKVDHLANQRVIREQLETKAKYAPQLMSDEDRLEYLGQRSVEEVITPEEIVEGKALELKIHGMSFGIFD